LKRTFQKSFSPCPSKNKHKTYGTNKIEKLKNINMHGSNNVLGENLSKRFLSMSLKKQ